MSIDLQEIIRRAREEAAAQARSGIKPYTQPVQQQPSLPVDDMLNTLRSFYTAHEMARQVAEQAAPKQPAATDWRQAMKDPTNPLAYAGGYRMPAQMQKDELSRSVTAGVGDVWASAGGTLKWIGADEKGQELLEKAAPLQALGPTDVPEWGWKDILNPRFWRTTIARSAPFSIALLPMGLLGAMGGGAVAGGTFAKATVGKLAIALGYSVATTVPEAALEAGGAYNDALSKGMTEEQADQVANSTFKKNLAMLGITNTVEWAMGTAGVPGFDEVIEKGVKGVAGKVLAPIARVGIAGLTEAGEEAYQEWAQQSSLGEDWSLWSPETRQAMMAGAAMGGGQSAAMNTATYMANQVRQKVVEKLSPEQAQAVKESVEEKVAQGVPAQQAIMEAMDEVAATPEGDKAIDEAVKEIVGPQATTQQQTTSQSQLKVPTEGPQSAIQVGQVVYHPQTGEALTVVDATDPATLKAKNGQGAEITIGKGVVLLQPGAQGELPTAPAVATQQAQEGVSQAPPSDSPLPQTKAPAPSPGVVSGVKAGDTVFLNGSPLTVVNTGDRSLLTVRNEQGAEFKVGRGAVSTEAPKTEPTAEPAKQPHQMTLEEFKQSALDGQDFGIPGIAEQAEAMRNALKNSDSQNIAIQRQAFDKFMDTQHMLATLKETGQATTAKEESAKQTSGIEVPGWDVKADAFLGKDQSGNDYYAREGQVYKVQDGSTRLYGPLNQWESMAKQDGLTIKTDPSPVDATPEGVAQVEKERPVRSADTIKPVATAAESATEPDATRAIESGDEAPEAVEKPKPTIAPAADAPATKPAESRNTGKTGESPAVQKGKPIGGDRVLVTFKDGTWEIGTYNGWYEYYDSASRKYAANHIIEFDDGTHGYEIAKVQKLAEQTNKPVAEPAKGEITAPKAELTSDVWRMTSKEFEALPTTQRPSVKTHRELIEQAIAERKPVPTKVLDEYPDLEFSETIPEELRGELTSEMSQDRSDDLYSQMVADDRQNSMEPAKKGFVKPKKTIKAYKLFRTLATRPGEIFPLFIGKTKPTPVGEWVPAEFLPTKGYAKRPGWHTGILPYAPHLMKKDGSMPKDRVWAEVELPADVDWQSVADQSKTKDIRDKIPEGGYYRFRTNKMQGGFWNIGGALKVNRILSDNEVTAILKEGGITSATTEGREEGSERADTIGRRDRDAKELDAGTGREIAPLAYKYSEEVSGRRQEQIERALDELPFEVRRFASEFVTFMDAGADKGVIRSSLVRPPIATCRYVKDALTVKDELQVIIHRWDRFSSATLAHEIAHGVFWQMDSSERENLMESLFADEEAKVLEWFKGSKHDANWYWNQLKHIIRLMDPIRDSPFYNLGTLRNTAHPAAKMLGDVFSDESGGNTLFHEHLLIRMAITQAGGRNHFRAHDAYLSLIDSEVFAYRVGRKPAILGQYLGDWRTRSQVHWSNRQAQGYGYNLLSFMQKAEEEAVTTAVQAKKSGNWYPLYITLDGKQWYGQLPYRTKAEAIARAEGFRAFQQKQARKTAPPKTTAQKEPWKMTRREFEDYTKTLRKQAQESAEYQALNERGREIEVERRKIAEGILERLLPGAEKRRQVGGTPMQAKIRFALQDLRGGRWGDNIRFVLSYGRHRMDVAKEVRPLYEQFDALDKELRQIEKEQGQLLEPPDREELVRKAAEEGKKIPEEVMAEFPILDAILQGESLLQMTRAEYLAKHPGRARTHSVGVEMALLQGKLVPRHVVEDFIRHEGIEAFPANRQADYPGLLESLRKAPEAKEIPIPEEARKAGVKGSPREQWLEKHEEAKKPGIEGFDPDKWTITENRDDPGAWRINTPPDFDADFFRVLGFDESGPVLKRQEIVRESSLDVGANLVYAVKIPADGYMYFSVDFNGKMRILDADALQGENLEEQVDMEFLDAASVKIPENQPPMLGEKPKTPSAREKWLEKHEQAKKPKGTIIENKAQDGIELRFTGKPDESVLGRLRDAGYKWNRKKKVWYKKGINQENLAEARVLVEGKVLETAAALRGRIVDFLRQSFAQRGIYVRGSRGRILGAKMTPIFEIIREFTSEDNWREAPGPRREIGRELQSTGFIPPTVADQIADELVKDLQAYKDPGEVAPPQTYRFDDIAIGDRVTFRDVKGREHTGTVNAKGRLDGVEVVDGPDTWDIPVARIIRKEPSKEAEISSTREGPPPTKGAEHPTVETRTHAARVGDWVASQLGEGKPLTSDALFRETASVYGGTMAQGKFTAKDAYDFMELGVNKRLVEMGLQSGEGVTAQEAVANIQRIEDEILSKIPTQTRRTTESDEFQQFSTPPNIAYTAAWVANIGAQDSVLEPSAGIGGLALWAKVNGAKEIVVNELSERRAGVLEELRLGRLFHENAEQLNNILPKNVKPTVVIMNPPFSATAGRMAGSRDTRFAEAHLEQALKRLEPSGRLVAIVGRGMADGSPSFREWWKKIKGEYNVRANVAIDGKNYKKYGTTFDVQLVVIDKTGPTPQGATFVGSYEDLGEVCKALEGIKNDRVGPAEQVAGQPTGETPAKEGRDESRPEPAVSPSTSGVGTRPAEDRPATPRVSEPGGRVSEPPRTPDAPKAGVDAEPSAKPGTRRGEPEGKVAEPSRVPKAEDGGRSEPVRPGQSGERAGQRSEPSEGTVETAPEIAVESRGQTQFGEEVLTGDESSPIYSRYVPQKLKIPGAKEHPSVLSESAAMAAVVPIEPTYTPDLPKALIETGDLSIAQLEAIVYAGQAMEQKLPDGQRRGYFIGDGTGVGKGRAVAGIILDNMRRGRKKAVWISKNMKLLEDAVRDWTALGGKAEDVFPMSKIKLGADIKQEKGILFVPYDTLKTGLSASRGELKRTADGNSARLDQLVSWFGKDYDGVIILDEAHQMQNCLPMKGVRGVKQASARALAGVELQKLLPNARIVYSSATGATDPVNLAYAERLGLWGEGTPFASANEFVTQISGGGLAAMELVARDMKAMGSYISRTLSYEGCTYDTLEHKLTSEQAQAYDTMARSWQIVLQNVDKALEITGQESDGRAKGNARAQFWGGQQRFFNQILTAMQMPSVIEAVEKDLANGDSIVMQLVNTNQAIQDRQLADLEDGRDLEDLDLTPRDILLQYLDRSFPTQQYELYTDENGHERSRPVVDSQGNPVMNQEALEAKEKLMVEVGAIKVPDGPLEIILNHFGVENVAEVTGRTRRVVRKPDKSGNMVRVVESWGERHSLADVEAFRADKKRILVFSEAGGTGQSYHADPKTKNSRHRSHYVIQPGWRADVCVQGFGRSHRTHETSQPHYRLVTTNLKGQKRFISTIARRLDQLGALTKGQRQTGSQGLFSAADNLEGGLAGDALMAFYQDLHAGEIKGMDGRETLKMMGLEDLIDEFGNLTSDPKILRDVPKFLNRILSLESSTQNRVFDEFDARLRRRIDQAIAADALDVGLEDFKADRIDLAEEKTVYTDPRTGAETKYLGLDVYHRVQKMTFDKVLQTSRRVDRFKGFYRNTKSGNTYAFFPASDRTLRTGEVVSRYRQVGQVQGEVNYVTAGEFQRGNWEALSETEARALWDEAMSKVPEFHKSKLHLISGTILPIWDRLPGGHQKVYRVKTADGKQFLGRVLSEREVDITLQRLGAGRAKQELTHVQMVDRVMQNNAIIHLSNGWRIVRRTVSGESRLELLGNNLYHYMGELEKAGVFTERINWATRFFIPVGENAGKVLEAITKYRPVLTIDMPDAMSSDRREAIKNVKNANRRASADLESIESELEEKLDAAIGHSSDLRIVPQAVANALSPPKGIADVDGYWIHDEEVRERWQAANGVRSITTREKFMAAAQDFLKKLTREFEHLPRTAEFAEIRTKLLELQKQPDVQGQRTFTLMEGLTQEVKGDPVLWTLFEGGVVFNDLQREYDAEHDLPYGIEREDFEGIKAALDKEIAKHPEVQRAIEQRREVWKAIVQAYVQAMEAIGFHVEQRFLDEHGDYREDYFHHQVLEMVNADYARFVQGMGQKLRTPTGRGWLKKREGSGLDINRNYVEAEFEVMAQMLFDVQKAKLIALVKDPKYNLFDKCKAQANEANLAAIKDIIAREKAQWAKAHPRAKNLVSLTERRLNQMKGRIAWAFGQLQQMAERGVLWDGDRHEFAQAVAGLAGIQDVDPDPTVRDRTFEFLAALKHTEHEGSMQAATVLKNVSERREFIRETLGDGYKTWDSMIPKGYVPWQPREGNVLFMANSIPEKIAEQIAEGLLEALDIDPDDVRQIMAVGGKRPTYVIKEAIALTLDNLMKPRSNDPSVKLARESMRGWKAWQILGPTRFFKAQVRNVSGDADAAFVGNPSTFKKVRTALEELYRFFYKGAPITGELKHFFQRGGFQSTQQVQDIGDVNQHRAFRHLIERKGGLAAIPEKAWRGYWDNAHIAANFRESILRYAANLDYLEQMVTNAEKRLVSEGMAREDAKAQIQDALDGKTVDDKKVAKALEEAKPNNFGASIPEEIMAIPDIRDRSYTMANQLLGAYDQVSVVGQAMANSLAPFWRFQEVNFKRYIQLYRNALADGRTGEVAGRSLKMLLKRSPVLAWKTMKFAAKAGFFFAMLSAYNVLRFPDEERELSEDVRSKPHIILGRKEDGSVWYFGNLGAVGDFLEWFSMDAPLKLVGDWLSGRITLKEAIIEMAKAPVNKVWQSLSWVKWAAEAVTDRKTFPNVFATRPIRDKWLYLFDQFGLGEEYKRLSGLPHRSYRDRLQNLLIYSDDPGEGSYYDTLDAKREFLKKIGKQTEFTGTISPRSNALYNLKLAIRYKDQDAAEKYLAEYVSLGGTAQGLQTSLRNMHPLHGLNKEEQMVFVTEWLGASGRERLGQAILFYERVLLGQRAREEDVRE